MITISEFIEKYNSFNSETAKQNYLKGFIKCDYAPLLNKKTVLELALNRSIMKKENGIEYIDMFTNKLNFIASIMVLYTNIIADKDSEGNTKTYEMYDLLVKNNVLDCIYEIIGKNELNELLNVNKLLLDTFYEKNNNIPFNADKIITMVFNKIESIMNGFVDSINNIPSENDIKNLLA